MLNFLAVLCREQVTFNEIMMMSLCSEFDFIVLAHWNNNPRVDMSLHSDTLFWFRVNQSWLFLLNDVCLVEKQQIPMLKSLVWPDRGSNRRSTILETNTLTITLPMRSINMEGLWLSLFLVVGNGTWQADHHSEMRIHVLFI